LPAIIFKAYHIFEDGTGMHETVMSHHFFRYPSWRSSWSEDVWSSEQQIKRKEKIQKKETGLVERNLKQQAGSQQ
jgi:hypothetical protein